MYKNLKDSKLIDYRFDTSIDYDSFYYSFDHITYKPYVFLFKNHKRVGKLDFNLKTI